MDKKREQPPYQRTRNDCSRPCNKNLHQKDIGRLYSSPNRQPSSPSLPSQPRRHKVSKPLEESQGNLGIPPIKKHFDHCGMAAHRPKQRGGLRVPECRGLLRMETEPNSLPPNLPTIGSTHNRPLRLPNIPSTGKLHVLQNGPRGKRNKCLPTKMGTHAPLCLPTLLPDRESPKEIEQPFNRHDTDKPCMDLSTLVPNPFRNVNRQPNPPPSKGRSLDKPKRRNTPTHKETPTSGMEGFQQQLQAEGIPEKAINLICNKRRKGTQYNYNCSWAQFSSWVSERNHNPIQCDLAVILDYLSHLFERGLSYRSINGQRSAISAFHAQINDNGTMVDVGKHSRVCELLGGIANTRPPKPRYFHTWDINTVIDSFKTQGFNELLSLKELSHKLATLLAITSLHRGMELNLLSTEKLNVFSDRIEFPLEGNLKHTRQGQTNSPSIFFGFTRDPRLCPKKCIEAYLERTLPLRTISTQGPLFISFMKPHKPVGRDTIRRWIVSTITQCGVDPSFTCHSVRGAAASKACKAGVPIPDILAKGNWSRKSTFEKFYNKPIVKNPIKNLQKGILTTLN